VGSKGELFPPKKVREKLNLRPKSKIIYKIDDGRLVVEPVPTLEEAFSKKPRVKITAKEFYASRRRLSKEAET
jgi:bifunctional DNA-binding transcriptional regulator/antitoxin component of YhaV-PrlF toxin-antitoxin module